MTTPSPAYSATGFRRFMDRLLQGGLEVFGLYYGNYRAEVIDNSGPTDKQNQGIITVRVPAIGDTPKSKPRVAYPKAAFAGQDFGHKFLPPVGAFVWVEFENGRIMKPDAVGYDAWGKSRKEIDQQFYLGVLCMLGGLYFFWRLIQAVSL